MGYWHTIHLFDYKEFRKNGFHDLMNDRNGFNVVCQKFLELTPFIRNGKSLPKNEKIKNIDALHSQFGAVLGAFNKDLSLKESNEKF